MSAHKDQKSLPSCCKPGKDFTGVIWRNGAFAGEFGDPYIQDTDLEGGQSAPSIRTLNKIIPKLLVDRRQQLTLFTEEDIRKVLVILDDMMVAQEIDSQKDQVKDIKLFPPFLERFEKKLGELKDGDRLVFTGGWADKSGGHAIMHTAERKDGKYILSIINTGQGCEYHPSTKKWFPKTKHKVAIAVKDIPPERFLDPAVWLLFWKLRVTHKKENDMEQLYEVLLPHLVGGPLAQAVDAAEASGLNGHYETVQRSGTCYYRCVLSTLRYLMKRDGFTQKQVKQLTFQIRCGYLDRTESDLKARAESGLPLEDSDVRMIRVACNQTAMAALKEMKRGSIDAKGLSSVRAHIDNIQKAVACLWESTTAITEYPSKLDMKHSDRYLAFSGFGLIADKRKTDNLKGGPTEATPELFVDLYDETTVKTFEDVHRVISETKLRCDRLRAKTSVSAGSIACHQISCLIQRTFTNRLPLPLPAPEGRNGACLYRVSTTRAKRMKTLKALRALILHYAAATLSVNLDRADETAKTITSQCALAVFDAVLRMRTEEAKDSKEGDILARILSGDTEDATRISGSTQVKGFMLSSTSFQGLQIEDFSARKPITDPSLLTARHQAVRYFKHHEFAKSPSVFGWTPQPPRGMGGYPQPTYQIQEDDTTIKFTKGLLERLKLMFTIPPRKKRGRSGGRDRGAKNPDAMTELERISRWLMGDTFPKAPALLLLRDVVFLHKLLLEDTSLLKAGNAPFRRVSLWFLSQAAPSWEFHDCNRDGTVTLLRVAICSHRHNLRVAPAPGANQREPGFPRGMGMMGMAMNARKPRASGFKSPADLSFFGMRADVDEDAVLQKQSLQRFGNTLSEEESEKLLTYLTAPYLAIPLVLEFFAQQRVGALLNPWLRDILESVLFEPRAYTPNPLPGSPPRVKTIPVDVKARDKALGTQYGVLMHEVCSEPKALLRPLAEILRQTLKLCIGDYTSAFATLLLRVLRITYFLINFVKYAESKFSPPECKAEKNEIYKLVGRAGATGVILRWISQCEAAGDVERATEMHAHLVMVHALLEDSSGWDEKTIANFCCSTAFTLSWHSQAKSAKFILDHLKDGKRRGQAIPLLPVPLHDVFLLYEKKRILICRWARAASAQELDGVLGRVASVSLQRANPGELVEVQWRGWNNVASKPLICSTVIESDHPYKPSTDYYETVRFPGAAYISIYFDEKTSTEEFSDYVTIYKDETCTAFWGKDRKLSGPSTRGWPGAGGRPPLVIPADMFVIHFHSDRSVEDWGFRFTAAAPVSVKAARQLADEKDKAGQPVGLALAQRALMETKNSLEDAKKYLHANLEAMKLELERERKEEEQIGADSEAKASSVGLYRDPMGSVQVNLQTAEVYLRNRMLMPVPSDIASHRDFHDVFDAAASQDGPAGGNSSGSLFCAIVENHLNRKLMTIVHSHHIYEVGSWTPLISNEMAQNMTAGGLSAADGLEPEAKGKEDTVEKKSSAASGGGGRLGGLPEQRCVNMPRRAPGVRGGLLFDGSIFIPYTHGSLGWVSELLDTLVEDAVKDLEMEDKPTFWVNRDDLKRINNGKQNEAKTTSERLMPSLCAQLLIYVGPQGDLEELKGHPGGFFEVQAEPLNETINVFYLREEGRRILRQCVFSSNAKFCLKHLSQDPTERDEPAKNGLRNAGGGLFDELLNNDGSMADRPGVGKLANNDVGSLVIRRNLVVSQSDRDRSARESKRAKEWGASVVEKWQENEFEEFIPGRFLEGVIPGVLTEMYQFWRSGDKVIRGYPRPGDKSVDPSTMLIVTLKIQVIFRLNGQFFLSVDADPEDTWKEVREKAAEKAGVRITQVPTHDYKGDTVDKMNLGDAGIGDWVSTIRRVPYYGGAGEEIPGDENEEKDEEKVKEVKENDDEDDEKEKSREAKAVMPDEVTLLNLVRATPGTVLGRLKRLLTRLENLSHVLVWTRSNVKESEEECEISLVELPRLSARFETRRQGDKVVLASLDYDGLYVAEDQATMLLKHGGRIPHAIVLNNSRSEYFLMIPNYGISRPKVKQCPFSTELVLERGEEWAKQVKTRYYVYPIHLSQSFIVAPSLSASFYMLVLRLMAREYEAAAKILSTCSTDTSFTDEEKWVVSLISKTEDDSHPNAHACRMRLANICEGCGEKPPVEVKKDKAGYLKKFPHVSVACRLTVDEEIQSGIDSDRLRYIQAVEQASRLGKPLEFPAGSCKAKQGGAMWHNDVTATVAQILPQLLQGFRFFLKYAQPSGDSIRGHGMVNTIDELFDDTMTGRKTSRGFILLYQLLMGNLTFSLRDLIHKKHPKHAQTMAKLLLQMKYLQATKMGKEKPKDEVKVAYGMLLPILVAREKKMDPKKEFPEFPLYSLVSTLEEGTGTNMNKDLNGWLMKHIQAASKFSTSHFSAGQLRYPQAAEVNDKTSIPADMKIPTRPEITDSSADQRFVAEDVKSASVLNVSDEDRKAFFTVPLSVVDLKEHIAMLPDDEAGKMIKGLPFKLSSSTRAAHTHVARKMIKRMEMDLKESASKAKGRQMLRIAYLTPEHLEAIRRDVILISGIPEGQPKKEMGVPTLPRPQLKRVETIGTQAAAVLVAALKRLEGLQISLEALADLDQKAIAEGSRLIEAAGNSVREDPNAKPEDLIKHIAYALEKLSGHRVAASFDHIVSTYLSSRNLADLKALNPFLSSKEVEKLMCDVSGVLFRCTRLSHCNRTLDTVKKLRKSIRGVIVKRLEEGWLRGSSSVYNLLAPTKAMLQHCATAHAFEETKARLLAKKLLKQEAQLVSKLTEASDGMGIDVQYLPSVVGVAFHLYNFDIKKTEEALTDVKKATLLLDLARRGCYLNGNQLWMPDTKDRSNLGNKSGTSSLSAMVHIMEHTAKGVASLLSARRGYTQLSLTTRGFDPRFLVFEFMAGFMMRPRQVEIILQFAESVRRRQSSVRQMIMGAGKTSVVSPMLALLLANGRVLVTQVVPKALLDQTRTVMRNVFSNVISKPIYTFHFDRASEAANSITTLEKLYNKLDRARLQRAIVCTTPEALKSLMLRYVDLLQSVEAASPILSLPKDRLASPSQQRRATTLAKELRQNALKADAMKRVLKLWSGEMGGVALLDEVDLILHPLKSELNFPIGPRERLPLGPERWLLPMHILEAFFFEQSGGRVAIQGFRPDEKSLEVLRDIASAMRKGAEDCAIQMNPHPVILQHKFYDEHLRLPVSRWAAIWLLRQKIVNEDIKKYGKAKEKGQEVLSVEAGQDLILAYISDLDEKKSKTAHDMANGMSSKSVQLLNLARDWVGSFLPHCLSKINRVAYGMLHPHHIDKWAKVEGKAVELSAARRLLAVPFIGLDVPSRAAEFAHPEVQIGLTTLAYRYEGLRRNDVRAVVEQLKDQLDAEQGPFAQRPSRMLFQEWLDLAARAHARKKAENEAKKEEESLEVLPLELFQFQDEKQLDVLFKVIRHLPDAAAFFLRERVFDRVMRHQATKLRASGADIGSDVLFGLRLGFSGTPSDLLPHELRPCQYEPGSEAKIVRVLTDPQVVSNRYITGRWTVPSLLLEVASPGCPAPYKALIDTGALVTGMTNEEVARFLLARGLEGIDACVFLDESDRKVVVDRSGGRPVPLSRCGVSPERYFTFYDQVHTTGMDIKQALDAKACVTLGKDMTLRDYAQGCYRLRGLARGQTLSLLIVDEVRELIRQASDTKDVLSDVVAWLLTNSMRSENLQHLALCGQLLHNAWRTKAWRSLMGSKAPNRARHGELLPSRFRDAITDEKEIKAILNEHSVLTEADKEAERKKEEEKLSKKRFDQVMTSMQAAGKEFPVPVQHIIREAGSMTKGVGALIDIAKSMGVKILNDEEIVKQKNENDEILAKLRMTIRIAEENSSKLPVPLNMVMGNFGKNAKNIAKGLSEFLGSCGIVVDTSPYTIEILLTGGDSKSMEKKIIKIEKCEALMPIAMLRQRIAKDVGVKKDKIVLEVKGKAIPDKERFSRNRRGGGLDTVTLFDYDITPDRNGAKCSAEIKDTSENKSVAMPALKRQMSAEQKAIEKMSDEEKLRIALEMSYGKKANIPLDPKWATRCVRLFREPLDFNVSVTIPEKIVYSEKLKEMVNDHRDFLTDQANIKIVEEILDDVQQEERIAREAAAGDSDGRLEFDAEMVQEEQKEQEQKQRQEVAQQVRVAYASGRQQAVRWATADLATAKKLIPNVFYPLKTFTLNKRAGKPLPYPRSILLSENFAPLLHRSDLARRLKNAHVLISWEPKDSGAKEVRVITGQDTNWMAASYVNAVIEAQDEKVTKEETEEKTEDAQKDYCVNISLAEAESLRRALQDGVPGLTGTRVGLSTVDGLWLVPKKEQKKEEEKKDDKEEFKVLTEKYTSQLKEAGLNPEQIPDLARLMATQVRRSHNVASTFEDGRQCIRFFDNQMWFEEDGIIRVLRALADAPESTRRVAFDAFISARRRDRTRWEGMPVAQIFAYSDEQHLMRMRDLALRVTSSVLRDKLSLFDVFKKFDTNGDGWLSQQELTSALLKLKIGLTEEECAQLLRHADSSQDGYINYREFASRFGAQDTKDDMFPALKPGVISGKRRKALPLNLLPSAASESKSVAIGEEEDDGKNSVKHMSYAELSALGSLSLASGGMAFFRDDGLVSTRPGYRPSLCPRGVCVSTGKWYYEITVVTAGRGVVGWGDVSFSPNFYTGHGVGDDNRSWGVDPMRQLTVHTKSEKPWTGPKWSTGDVIGVQAELVGGISASISYSVNGKPIGVAFDKVKFNGGLTPFISFESALQFRANFGTRPWRYAAPPGCRSPMYWSRNEMRRIHALNSGSLFGKLKPTTGDAQMTLKANSNGTTTISVSNGFPTAVLQGCLITTGRWYYEFTIKRDGVAQVGWCDLHFYASTRGGVGTGDDKHSWGYDGHRVLLWHNGKFSYGRRWKEGDVIGCAVDIDARRISFSHNSEKLGPAAENMEFVGGLAPAITLNPCSLIANFGSAPFRFGPPAGYLPVQKWLRNYSPNQEGKIKFPSGTGLQTPTSGLSLLKLQRSVSMMTRPSSELKRVPLRASSGYTQSLINDRRISATSHYPSVVADRVLLTEGKWYYEVKLVSLEGKMGQGVAFIGWCDAFFFGDSIAKCGLGDDSHSWGWGVTSGRNSPPTLKHDGKSSVWFGPAKSRNWKPRDVIGCAVDVDAKTIQFSLNGVWAPQAAFLSVKIEKGLTPAMSVNSQCELEVNFGSTPLAFKAPVGFETINTWWSG